MRTVSFRVSALFIFYIILFNFVNEGNGSFIVMVYQFIFIVPLPWVSERNLATNGNKFDRIETHHNKIHNGDVDNAYKKRKNGDKCGNVCWVG